MYFILMKTSYLFGLILAGLEHAKKCVTEMVIWPLLRPDIFQGCRSPGKGLLLFGPPVCLTTQQIIYNLILHIHLKHMMDSSRVQERQ